MLEVVGLDRLSEIPRKLPFHLLVDITNCFEQRLGHGAFGVVYKGILPSGEIVAVKRLVNTLELQDVQFENEVNHLMMLNNKNIVRLVGFCYELQVTVHQGRHIPAAKVEKVICYEYMANGSLEKMIYDVALRLDWNMYFKIITGICSGLTYLHGVDIIHLDLKPSNVLLDGSMIPKLGDFGLSRLFGEEQSRRQTMNVVGTKGYMAPEYFNDGEITTKSDIYSLGVLILEIVTGERNLSRDVSGLQYINNVRKKWKKSQLASRYPFLGNDRLKEVQGCVTLGLLCVETNPKKRPTAQKLFRMLTELRIEKEEVNNYNYEYMLPARSLVITGSNNARYWRWIHLQHSRTAECAELLQVTSLHICGSIRTNSLCAARCSAYLVYKLTNFACGFEWAVFAEIRIGGTLDTFNSLYLETPLQLLLAALGPRFDYPVTRADGWMEIKLGEFVNSSGQDKELTVIIRTSGTNPFCKKGLIIQCVEIRRVN